MINTLFFMISFLTPSFKLSSKKTIYLKGSGPPLLFSTGLFGGMPNFLYSNIQNKLSKNFTLLLNKDYKPFILDDIEEIKEEINVDCLSLFSHSSIDSTILESPIFNKMILCDPIVIPNINFNGFSNKKIKNTANILVIKAEKLYNSDRELPSYQNPIFSKNKQYSEIIYSLVGHPDMLNNYWADLAVKTQLWRGVKNKPKRKNFKDWKYIDFNNNKKEIYKYREIYRKFIVNETINFIL